MDVASWGELVAEAPPLARFAQERLARAPSYLATVRSDGWPRVHPVGPLTPRGDRLVVVMYPTSPKGHDLRRTGRWALHAGVEDQAGGQGELMLTGHARPAEPSEDDAEKGYVAFELLIGEVLAVRYDELGDLQAERWRPSRPDSD